MRPGRPKVPEPPPRPSAAELAEIAGRWRAFRKLYPTYAEIARQFEMGPGCSHLEAPSDRSEPAVVKEVEDWFTTLDERFDASHLRQVVQTTPLGTEEALRGLLVRYLGKQTKTVHDRDKIDFLLVQYLDQCAPHSFQSSSLELDDIAFVLEPVLGEASTVLPSWLAGLDGAMAELAQCRSLRDLLERGIIERVRAMKESGGPMYFGSASLLAITRFNFQMRRAFFRLLSQDLRGIRNGIGQLEGRGIHAIDCAAAQLSPEEPLEHLHQICGSWKQPFRAPYAAGQPLRQLVEVRTAVERALAAHPGQATQSVSTLHSSEDLS